MPRAPEFYDFDEQGVMRKALIGGQSQVIVIIKTLRNSFDLLEPFDQSERDLVRLAVAVLNADRQCLRRLPGNHSEEAQEANRLRSLRLRIPMENPERWNDAMPLLVQLLRFMTDDQWVFEFTQATYTPGEQLPLFPTPVAKETELALFSGGLDSVAGLWVRHRAEDRPFIAVTAYGDNAKLARRTTAIETLHDLGVRVDLLQFQHYLRWAPSGGSSQVSTPESQLPGGVLAEPAGEQATSEPVVNASQATHEGQRKEEKSQRTRGFVFFSIAAAMASVLRLSAVATYEAGVGALNMPANDAQIGAQNTRAMHPWTLSQLERLFQEVLERPIRLEAPFLRQTKGEVCRQAGTALKRLAHVAMSCDETEARKSDLVHCGVCTSCLLRRVALRTALGDDDPTVYRDRETGTHGHYDVRAFVAQAARFKEAGGSFNRLIQLDPSIRHALRYHADRGLPRHEAERQMCELFSRQAAEAESFVASFRFPRFPPVMSITEAHQ